MTPRKTISTRERVRLFTLHGGICHLCGSRVQVGDAWDVEHVLPLAMGGDDDDDNRRPAHKACHRLKTRGDVADIAKAKRRHAAFIGAKAPSRNPLPGGRGSPWKKTFGQGWVRR